VKFRSPGHEPVPIALTSGHTMVITKDGTETPPQFRREALARGCLPADMNLPAGNGKPEPTKAELIAAAIEKLLDGDEKDAFGTDGKPSVKALSAAAGFNVSSFERDAAWNAYEAKDKDGK
jgi:hypothetical protein